MKEIAIIIPKEKFTFDHVNFLNEAFHSKYRITFFLYGDDNFAGYRPPKLDNCIIKQSWRDFFSDAACRRLISCSSLVVLHWVELRLLLALTKMAVHPVLVFWGGDLYPYFNPTPWKMRVKQFLLRLCSNRARAVCTLTEGDSALFSRLITAGTKRFVVTVSGLTRERVETLKLTEDAELIEKQAPFRVLVGNSATPTNRHLEAFDLLERYRDEDIEIIVPLSYGDESYAASVVERGRAIFGGKFVPVLDFMELAEYTKLLRTVAVGVFANDRQQGMGNISILLRSGAKVYVPSETSTWGHYSDMGVKLFKTEDIGFQCFEEFVAIDKSIVASNREAVSADRMRRRAIDQWSRMFEGCVN